MRTLITFFLLTTIAIGQEGIPANVGDGTLPPGLEGETDLNAIRQRRIDASQAAINALHARFNRGLDNSCLLLVAQNELLSANLDSTTAKKERLDHIETALTSALLAWQRVKELQLAGVWGGDAAAEVQARAAVFKFRAMWLAENAAVPQSPSNLLSRVPQSTKVALSLSADKPDSCPLLIDTRACCGITQTHCNCSATCHRANHVCHHSNQRTGAPSIFLRFLLGNRR